MSDSQGYAPRTVHKVKIDGANYYLLDPNGSYHDPKHNVLKGISLNLPIPNSSKNKNKISSPHNLEILLTLILGDVFEA